MKGLIMLFNFRKNHETAKTAQAFFDMSAMEISPVQADEVIAGSNSYVTDSFTGKNMERYAEIQTLLNKIHQK